MVFYNYSGRGSVSHGSHSSFLSQQQPQVKISLFRGAFFCRSLFNVIHGSTKLTCHGSHCLCQYRLLLAGDVELNPGPTRDAKPQLLELQCMSYSGEDGKTVSFRLMDRIKPRLTAVAIALGFPQHIIDFLNRESHPEYCLFSKWLGGGNQENDSRPLTWATLVSALQHAGLPEEVTILEQHFLVSTPVAAVSQANTMSTHEPVPALSSIAVDPSPYSSLQYTYHSQPLHDILYNEPMIPSYPNVESSFTQRPHPHYPPQLYPSPYYFRSQHPNPNRSLIHSAITPTFNPRFSYDPFQYGHCVTQQPRLDTPSHPSFNVPSYQTTIANTLTHSSQFSHNPSHDGPPFPQRPRLGTLSHSSLYHYNIPSYQTTTANTLTHSSQLSHDGPPLPQRPRQDTPSLAMVDPLATATAYHSSSHVTHSLSTPFFPHVGQSSDTIPSSSETTSSRPPSHPSPYSSSDCASSQHSPSHGLPPPKHPRLDTAPSSPITTLHPTITVLSGPHRDPGYESTSTAASPSVATPIPPATTVSPCLQRYVTYLKQLYIAKKTPVYDKESTLLYFKAKSFINIALVHKNVVTMTESDKNEMIMDRLHGHVDAIQKKKTKLNFSNVCKCEDGSVAHSVLVEGAPGVGKTTFAFELCKQWARGEILQEWGVVVIIKLRDQRTRTAQTINDLLYHPDPKLRQDVVTELVEQSSEGMLLILDGYDELTIKQIESGSVIQCLMSRELLCRATLMVTSRPLATRTLHPNFQQSIDQHIEVLGFTDKNIQEYINSACGDKPELVEDFKEYLSSHPFSSALMFNPLQCAIVTDLYRSHWQCGDKGFAPKTLTELYTGLVHTLLLRYLTHHPVHKDNDWTIKDLNDLPKDVKQQLKAVTVLAAKGIEDQQYVFDSNVPSETLGLMQREEELTAGIGRSSSHNFLHLTLQEYLAAVYYSQQCDSPEQLTQLLTRDDLFPLSSFLQYYGKKRQRTIHWPVALFLAGRTQLGGVPLDLLKAGLHDYSSVDVSLLHLLYETQCPQLIQSTLVTSRQYISVHGRSALDWFVIGYCIANSTSNWRVQKKVSDVLKYFNQLVMGLKLAPQDGSGEGKIVSLDISGSWSGNFKILSQLQPFTKNVTDIKLVGPQQDAQHNPVSSKGKAQVKEELDCYTPLKDLTVENAMVNFPYSRFIPQQSNLHTITLSECKLNNEATNSFIPSLLSPHGKLNNFSLFNCTFSTTDHTYQISLFKLQQTNCRVSLNATGSSFVINHCLSLLSSSSKLLTDMNLNITKQDSSTDELLEEIGLYHHEQNSLTLSLTKCKLSNEALISSLLFSCCKLHKLSLRDCTISTTDYSCQFSFFELQQANAKVSLNATCSYCAINHWLSQSSSYSTLLTDMFLCITEQDSSTDVTLVGIGLYEQNNLHTLSLKRCKLSSKTTSSLIHSLRSTHCKLHKISLNDCAIFATDHTYQFCTLTLQVNNGKVSLNATGSCCAINHWLSQLSSYSVTELILSITKQKIDETLERIGLFSHMLEILNINNNHTTCFSVSIPLFLELRQNNLHTLSLTKCKLSSEATSSLIHSLLSPDYKLNKLALDECVTFTTDHTYQFSFFEFQNNNDRFSLTATGSCCAINYWLSQLSSYSVLLTELILSITKQETDETLEGISLFSHMLEILNINNNDTTCFSFSLPLFFELHQNNLHTLSLTKCKLSSEATSSLIHSLLSPDCRLQKVLLDNCITSTTDHTYQFSFFELEQANDKVLLNATGSCRAINHWLSQLSSYSVLLTELVLSITEQETDETLEGIGLFSHMLEILNINNNHTTCFSFSIPLFLGLRQNNLHTLSLTKCRLSSEATSSLIHSLLSPDYKLNKLALYECAISFNEHTYTFSAFKVDNCNVSLEAKGSPSAFNHWLSYLSSFSKIMLIELILAFSEHASSNETFESISLYRDVLEVVKIDGIGLGSLSSFRFLGQQHNNLHTLSMEWCRFSSKATSSLIHFLQSPHCRLHKLALYYCTIPTTDCTLLTTAIFSSTTITHLLFIDYSIDTPSLTALASGLKQNRTMEELAVNNNIYSAGFTKEQLKLLIEGVDSSAVNKLWLHNGYKELLSDCPLSRDDVVIEWYNYGDDVYKKW